MAKIDLEVAPTGGAVSGHKGRDRWICVILTRDDVLTPLELRVAVLLGIFFNCKTGQCNPGYARLAKELGVPPRSVRRAVAALVAYGFIGRDEGAGGRHDQKRNFSLFMPPPRRTDIVSSLRRTACVSPVETEEKDQHGAQEQGVTGDKNAGKRGTIRGPRKEPDEPEEPDSAALCAARTSRVDRESVNSSTADDAKVPVPPRAPEGARSPTPAHQPQSRATEIDMGRAANADAARGTRFDLQGGPPGRRGTADAFDGSRAVTESRGYIDAPAASARCPDTLDLFSEEVTEDE